MIGIFSETAYYVTAYSAFCILVFLVVSHTMRQATRKRRYRATIILLAWILASVPVVHIFALIAALVIQAVSHERRSHFRRLG